MKYLAKTLLIISFSMFLINCGGKNKTEETKTARIAVNVAEVKSQDIQGVLGFFGNIEGEQSVKVFSTMPNRVTNIYVEIGDRVIKGQLLATINADKISDAVTQAEAGLEATQSQYNTTEAEFQRVQKLFDENVVSQSHYDAVKTQRDAAKSAVKQMKAALSAAKSQYQDTRIASPISGVVSMKNYELGDMAAPQMPFFEIVDMDPIKVSINVIERYLGLITPGLDAVITVNGYPGATFSGKVSIVNPTLDSMTRTANAEIIIDNKDLKLKPGMFANVEVITEEKINVPVIPDYAIIEKTTLDYTEGSISTGKVKIEKFVFTVQDSIALKKQIKTGISHNNLVEVLSGLEPGETLVTQGQHILLDSSLVNIIQ
ncbi:efflux RND transporter periplasmic adaptor subunit [Candidatus Neomarinimicrobiota bacterium]